ncbi:hypothetical protein [Paenibacillus humicola]|uniref:hypothetical protein n=1 Tax=Paenibacillus humicola TaxID=3110540 RepID=UPI00237AEF78|nr:hypothetical protein [Paenibacillus humicola]
MPFIPNFPPALLEEHRRWHHANHHTDPSQLPPGYGREFLNFHRQFIAKALQWYRQQGYDQRLVAPWTSVPEGIRSAPCYNRQAEARILNNLQSFATADELGLFIEGSNLHGCMHQESARVFGEEMMNDFDTAPESTIFYNIHGMIDNWYKNWESVSGVHVSGRSQMRGGAARMKRRPGSAGAGGLRGASAKRGRRK